MTTRARLAQFPMTHEVADPIVDGCVIGTPVCELGAWQIMEPLLPLADIVFLQKHISS